jgi:hypothetical protein
MLYGVIASQWVRTKRGAMNGLREAIQTVLGLWIASSLPVLAMTA